MAYIVIIIIIMTMPYVGNNIFVKAGRRCRPHSHSVVKHNKTDKLSLRENHERRRARIAIIELRQVLYTEVRTI